MAQERILIIDGDISFSAIFKARLEAMGYLVDHVVTAHEALDVLKAKWVDLIVLAVVLQGNMSGFQLFKEIRAKRLYKKIPVIVESGKPAMQKMFERMGVETFFTKPYPLDTLLNEIKDMVSKKILVVSAERNINEAISHMLYKYDLPIDILYTVDKFSTNINAYRYCLIILQYKINSSTADELVSLVKESRKNKNSPIVIITTGKRASLDKAEVYEIQTCKERCEQLGVSSFLDNGFSPMRFIATCKQYIVSY